MKRLTTLFLSCVVCAGVALAQDAKPLKAVYTGKLLEQSEQVGIRGAARVQADAVLAEDFSKFTKGTEADPDDEDLGGGGTISSDYTQTPGWTGSFVYQAGGEAYIGMSTTGMVGYLMTPTMDLSGNDGVFTVSFKAKSRREGGDKIYIQNYLSGSYFDESKAIVEITEDWQDYSVEMDAGATTSYLRFMSYYADWYVDDIKVTNSVTTSIKDLDVMQTKPTVKAYGNELYVENPKAETVEVFNVDGTRVFSSKAGEAVVKTTLSGRGVYIVKVGNKVTKVCAGK